MDGILLEFSLDMMKAESDFESTKDIYALNLVKAIATESYTGGGLDDGIMSEATGSFSTSLKAFFMKVRDAITKFIRNMQIKITAHMAEKDMSKTYALLKRTLSTGEIPSDVRVPKIDVSSYYTSVTKYIGDWTKELEKFYKHASRLKNDVAFAKIKGKLDQKIENYTALYHVRDLSAFTKQYTITGLYSIIGNELGNTKNILTNLNKLADKFNNELWQMASMQTPTALNANTVYSALQTDLNRFASFISTAIKVIGGCLFANCKSVLNWYNSPAYDQYQNRKMVEQQMEMNQTLSAMAKAQHETDIALKQEEILLKRQNRYAQQVQTARDRAQAAAYATTAAKNMQDMYNGSRSNSGVGYSTYSSSYSTYY